MRTVSNAADIEYVRNEFRAIDRPSSLLPAPSYYDEAGTAYVPHTYEAQETDKERFIERARSEMARLGAAYDDAWLEDAWRSYWDGIYGICLKEPLPEHIVRKSWLIDRIVALIETPQPSERWRDELRSAVDALDALEMPFCDFDRAHFGRPVSRDVYITEVRHRFLSPSKVGAP